MRQCAPPPSRPKPEHHAVRCPATVPMCRLANSASVALACTHQNRRFGNAGDSACGDGQRVVGIASISCMPSAKRFSPTTTADAIQAGFFEKGRCASDDRPSRPASVSTSPGSVNGSTASISASKQLRHAEPDASASGGARREAPRARRSSNPGRASSKTEHVDGARGQARSSSVLPAQRQARLRIFRLRRSAASSRGLQRLEGGAIAPPRCASART